jgi:mono/diheme cytochrome c family protein
LIRPFTISVFAILGVASMHLSAQRLHYAQRPDVENGAKVYKGGCIACHDSDGKGAPMEDTVFLRAGYLHGATHSATRGCEAPLAFGPRTAGE